MIEFVLQFLGRFRNDKKNIILQSNKNQVEFNFEIIV